MGLHEAPMSFRKKSQVKTICVQQDPQYCFFFFLIQMWREKAQEHQSSPGYWDGGFSPHDSIFSKPALLDTKDVKRDQKKKKQFVFKRHTQNSQGKHDLQTVS